ncbi:MAG: isoprenylcysteine carboxylmethyltransferase family protein [Acidobacteria bacterium]|nr:MAG: isoprenylcysteine carboxylmethyltransferase family protein [Acidobacteriota bacterium]
MRQQILQWIPFVWLGLGIFWFLSRLSMGLDRNPAVRRQSGLSRLLQLLVLFSATLLLFSEWPRRGVVNSVIVPPLPEIALGGFALTILGVAFAIVARAYLGRNWSGRPTIKSNHELIYKGPYSLVRHPIYTGIFVAATGTALAFGELRNLLALPFLLIGFWLKLKEEERLLVEAFGQQYAEYRLKVKSAFIPFLL